MNAGMSSAPSLWRGDRGLACTFWISGVLGGGALVVFFLFAAQATDSIIIGLIGFLAVWGWLIFAGVSIWRAAARYEGSPLWAALARIAVVVGALGLWYGTALLVGLV